MSDEAYGKRCLCRRLTEIGSLHAVGFTGSITSRTAASNGLGLDVKLQKLLSNAVFFSINGQK